MPVKPGRLHTLPRLIVSGKRVLGSSLAGSKDKRAASFGEAALRLVSGSDATGPAAALLVCRTESTEISYKILLTKTERRASKTCNSLDFFNLGSEDHSVLN